MKAKALVMFSGGLDSILAIRLMKEQGIRVEAVHFLDPFGTANYAHVKSLAKRLGVKLHAINKDDEYLGIVRKPKHGYGRNMNPCIDCRIYTFRKAWELARSIGADFLVTGEVLGERPMSQNKKAMMLIEKEAGLGGKVLRPLSARLMPQTEAEKDGLVDRDKLEAIRGRSRKRQMELVKKFGIVNYPSPAGGCLLTDAQFSQRLRDLMGHGKFNMDDIELLRLGRHFRLGKSKAIVGRNEHENGRLLRLAREQGSLWMEVKGYMGPVTVVKGRARKGDISTAAGLTVRYSDAPARKEATVEIYESGRLSATVKARPLLQGEISKLII